MQDKFANMIDTSLTQILQAQQKWQNHLSGFGLQQALLKSIKEQNTLYTKNFAGFDSIAMSIAMRPEFNIPTTAFDAITAISKQHDHLFGSFRNITEMLQKHTVAYNQFNNLKFAVEGISSQMATIAAAQKKWNFLDDFQSISQTALEISESVASEMILTEEENQRFRSLIEVVLSIIKRNRKFGTKALMFFSVIVSLMELHQYYDFFKDKPEPATKEDIAKLEKKLLQEITLKLKEQKEYRTTNRECKVMLKPKMKSFVVTVLPIGYDVIVLQSNKKWLLISYSNPKDKMSETGWVLKKYLNKPE